MPSAVVCGLLLPFIVTKIVTSVLSGVVVDGPLCCCGGPPVPRFRGRPHGRHPGLHAADAGAHYTPPQSSREPPVRAGQRPAFPSNERTSARRPPPRFLSSAASCQPDHRSGSDQASRDRAWPWARRSGAQAALVHYQRTAEHRSTASGAASPRRSRETPVSISTQSWSKSSQEFQE